MDVQATGRRSGRRRKDDALILRDRYWALGLKAYLPDESLSSIERLLWLNIRVGRREEGQGYRQPFALAKIAAGTRGISDALDGTPPVVERARSLWPASEAVFTSCIWAALHERAWLHRAIGAVPGIGNDVRCRLKPHHLVANGRSQPWFSPAGICRLGRLTHLDALGLLLLGGGQTAGGTYEEVLAQLYVPPVFGRICQFDPIFAALEDTFRGLITRRYASVADLCDSRARAAFNSRSTRAWKLMQF